MKTIDLVYFNAGGGHRSAALAIEAVVRDQGRPWLVRPINLIDVLDPRDVFRKTTGMAPEDLYNTRLAHGWSLGLSQELKLLQALIRLSHTALVGRLRRHWRHTRPDMVVSLIPNFNRAMAAALAAARPGAPYVTLMTDFADLPPHFWMEPRQRQRQHLICGTPKAVAQAHAAGFADDHIHPTSGMIIRPEFYRESRLDRRIERCKLALDPDRPTGIVLFGGHGSAVMQNIARTLSGTQLILVCGHNAALARRLSALPPAAPRLVLGFTANIRHFLQLSDFFIGKPGPGSISEAVQQGLPVIVVKNTWTMPQERYNTEWVTERGAGIVLDSFKSVRGGVDNLIARLPELRANVARIRNHAIFEIPDIFARLLQADPARGFRPAARMSVGTTLLSY